MENSMAYSKEVNDNFNNPKHTGKLDETLSYVGTGLVGAPACGDVMKVQIEVGEDGHIKRAVFKTFGCKAAIASSEYATNLLNSSNLTLEEALKIKNKDISHFLSLPPVKNHCSMLAEEAIQAAVNDYKEKQKQLKNK
jgi:nitrogen fixation NifU-like protein